MEKNNQIEKLNMTIDKIEDFICELIEINENSFEIPNCYQPEFDLNGISKLVTALADLIRARAEIISRNTILENYIPS